MYIQHFGLAQYPFSLAPNTQYFLKLPSHQQAFDFIIEALGVGNIFVKVTGGPGFGKTMLCRKVMKALEAHSDRYVVVHIADPVLDEEGTIKALARELNIHFASSANYYELLKVVSEELIRLAALGKTAVLFLDEAQTVTEESLEAIRLLTTISDNSLDTMPLQVILFGEKALDELLQRTSLQELNQDVGVSFELALLSRESVETYLNHRLVKAGFNGESLFTQNAIDLISSHSEGNPRIINILAHKALMIAFNAGDRSLTENHVQAALETAESLQ